MSDESSNVRPDRTLNTLGLYCPDPLFKTSIEMQKMESGQVLEVLADDPAAEADIIGWVKRTGQTLLSFTNEDGHLRFLVKKLR